jgi:hypothetical protein
MFGTQMVPKPRSRHRYCGVCRNHYEDYMNHTTGPDHAACLTRSYYQAMNADLCHRFQYRLQAERQTEEDKVADTTSEWHTAKSTDTFDAASVAKSDCPRF